MPQESDNMSPPLAVDDLTGCGLGYSKSFSNRAIGKAKSNKIPHRGNFALCELGRGILGAFLSGVSTLGKHVSGIVRRFSDEKMLRVNTAGVVASVAHNKAVAADFGFGSMLRAFAFWNGKVPEHLKHDSVGGRSDALEFELTMPVVENCPRPGPAFRWRSFIDFGPEPFRVFFVHVGFLNKGGQYAK
jgi:hypothetical protein